MSALISKTRSKKSKQRDKEDRKNVARRPWPVTCILLVLFLWVSTLFVLHIGGSADLVTLALGQTAADPVISQVEFRCIDLNETQISRKRAEETVLPVFSISYDFYNDALRSLGKLFDRTVQIRGAGDEYPRRKDTERAVGDVLDLLGIALDSASFLKAVPEGKEVEVLSVISNSLKDVYARGIASEVEKSTSFKGIARGGRIQLQHEPGAKLIQTDLKDLLLVDTALKNVAEKIDKELSSRSSFTAVWSDLLKNGVVPSLHYQPDATDELRGLAADEVQPVEVTVRAGIVLVAAGELVTPAVEEKLRAHAERQQELITPLDRVFMLIADASLLIIAMVVMVGLLLVFKSPVLTNKGHLFLIIILSLIAIISSKAMLYLGGVDGWFSPGIIRYLVPVALTSLLATVLLNAAVGTAIGFWTSIAVALLFGRSFGVMMLGLLVTSVSVHTAQDVHRRSSIFRVGFWVGLAGALYAVTAAVLLRYPLSLALVQVLVVFVNGMLCAILALLLIPLFEVLFNITTDIKLLELSDMSNPLLQRLAIEAPGTYHHSLMVANLAHAAAQQIGARSLLVRVGAYFHDIGKLTKPEFFIENTQMRDNPHDDLAPSMSTLVVTSHVKEGVTLAHRHNLPQVLMDAIEQHHGTSVVSYFYHRARKQQESDKDVSGNAAIKEEDYRYVGPRPMSREMGILSLADPVEAASRSMDKPTAARIENLVREIMDKKLMDGQLDDCMLTMADLAAIRCSFVFTLTNMLHARVPYPQDENRNKQQTKKTSEPSEGQTAPKTADGAGSNNKSG